MTRALTKSLVRTAALAGFAALLLHADSSGPNPGLAGIPGEAGTCANCHGGGGSNVNTRGGNVNIAFPKGNAYVPGEVQQAAARRAAVTSTLAGGFKASDANSQVLCSDTLFRRVTTTTTGACSSTTPLMYVEHTSTGTRQGTTGSVTFEFDWTARCNPPWHRTGLRSLRSSTARVSRPVYRPDLGCRFRDRT